MTATLSAIITAKDKSFTIVSETRGFLLLERADGKRSVVRGDRDRRQVYSVSGNWVAPFTERGVDYVASWLSPNTATAKYRRLERIHNAHTDEWAP